MGLTLEALSALDLIARRGSFAAAAADLGKVPSALTYQIRRLEDELDVLIFDRRGRRAQLTEAGRELLAQGRQLLDTADTLTRRVRQIATGWEHELRIAIDATIPFDRLLPLIADFDRLGSPTQLRLSHEVLNGCWDALFERRADLAIGASYEAPTHAFDSDRFARKSLGGLGFVFCVAPHHPLATAAQPIPAEALRAHRAVVIADTARTLPARTTGLLTGQAAITVATFEQKAAAQLAGVGCGYLPLTLARPFLEAGTLVERRLAHARPSTVLSYVWRKPATGKAMRWWLSRLDLAVVRRRLLEEAPPRRTPGRGARGRRREALPA